MTPCLRACTLSARTYDTPCHFVCYNNTSIAMRNVHAHAHTSVRGARPRRARGDARGVRCVCLSPYHLRLYGFRTFRSPRRFARGFAVLYALCRWGAADYTEHR